MIIGTTVITLVTVVATMGSSKRAVVGMLGGRIKGEPNGNWGIGTGGRPRR